MNVPGVERIVLEEIADERGSFIEAFRRSSFVDDFVQLNFSKSRKGVIRGLHYHLFQDDLFFCVSGTARVVVLDTMTGDTFCEDIGDDNPVAIRVPGINAHGYEAITDCILGYLVTREYDRDVPDEHGVSWDDPRVKHLWSTDSPILSHRDASA